MDLVARSTSLKGRCCPLYNVATKIYIMYESHYLITISKTYTVEPPNKEHVGTSYFFLYREVFSL